MIGSSVRKGRATQIKSHFVALVAGASVFVGASSIALAGSDLAAPSLRPSASAIADALLRSRCLASPIGATPSSLTVRKTRTTTWGFFLAGRTSGFRPGEPVLTLVTEPSSRTASCLENGNATTGGVAQGTAALWYRQAAPGRYRLCLVGLTSARVACGSFVLPKPARASA